jgi:tetratricopeptide (TPR) repeat protein/2-polyprenyl-3-methyl-5-hydroxy-6-metoxy-1,4-benzoquinol methylase
MRDALPPVDPLLTAALAYHQRGQVAEAERLYHQVLAANPRHAEALHFSGMAALQQGRLEIAARLIAQSLRLRENDAQAHYHLGLVMAHLGRFEEAAMHNRRAIALKPDFQDAHTNLGNSLKALGRLEEAARCHERVVAANPSFAAGHYNLANVFVDMHKFDAAIDAYERALAADPTYLPARQNFGTALLMLGRLDDAVAQFKIVIDAGQDSAEAQLGLATALVQQGKAQDALGILCNVLNSNPSPDAKLLFVECVKGLSHYAPFPGLEKHLIAALTEPWKRPGDIARYAATAAHNAGGTAAVLERALGAGANFKPDRLEIETLGSNRLLRAILENAEVVGGPNFERMLTTLRRECLLIALAEDAAVSDALLALACALARRCFVNEYVFSLTSDESDKVQTLCERFVSEPLPPLTIAVAAAYRPLHDIAGVDRLLRQTWPLVIEQLLTQQVREPRLELQLRDAIPRLTPINDVISAKVQQQYEENPYPRWIKNSVLYKARPLDEYVRKLLPLSPFVPTRKTTCEILVAGCGTGQQPIEIALSISNSRLLAVDLSLASLAHAQRKTRELGLTNIEYGQADILNLASLGRTFDYITATGVLHHLADPVAGWRSLAELLRPGGVMMLALYSKIATEPALAAHAFVAAERFPSTLDGIKRARQAIMAMPKEELATKVMATADFYSAGGCRDLLFHVQEQRFVIPQIKTAIADSGMRFLGFFVPANIVGDYRVRFPDDRTLTDLDNWNTFEIDNPRTFEGMYLFVLQKGAFDRA